MNSERRFLLLSVALPPLVLGAFLIGYFAKPSMAVGDDLDVVEEAYLRIQDRYHAEIKEGQLEEGAIEGMLTTLDPYCAYYTKDEWEKFYSDHLQGKFAGVGIVVAPSLEHGFIEVVTTIIRTPASRSEIEPGDIITHVDGRSLKDKGIEQAVKWIRGEVGTEVVLTVFREGKEPFDVKIRRAIIEVPAMQTEMIDPENGIGYMHVIQFQELIEEFDRKIAEMEEKGLKALIVDLRFNGGGLLRECVTLSDRFIDEGVIVSTRGKTDQDNKEHLASPDETRVRIPVVVLVNEETASASEIFAAAIKDHGRGKLVGARTFGKGSVQTPMKLADESWMKITTARYFTPNGTSVHREKGKKEYGIEPDYLIETTGGETRAIRKMLEDARYGKKGEEDFEDPQMAAALEIIKAELEDREPKVEPRLVDKEKK